MTILQTSQIFWVGVKSYVVALQSPTRGIRSELIITLDKRLRKLCPVLGCVTVEEEGAEEEEWGEGEEVEEEQFIWSTCRS